MTELPIISCNDQDMKDKSFNVKGYAQLLQFNTTEYDASDKIVCKI